MMFDHPDSDVKLLMNPAYQADQFFDVRRIQTSGRFVEQ
jgi:hypothetical protein